MSRSFLAVENPVQRLCRGDVIRGDLGPAFHRPTRPPAYNALDLGIQRVVQKRPDQENYSVVHNPQDLLRLLRNLILRTGEVCR